MSVPFVPYLRRAEEPSRNTSLQDTGLLMPGLIPVAILTD